jgi:hypothetical protein
LGEEIVYGGKDDKENESENAGKDRPEHINNSDDSKLVVAKDNHWNTNQGVKKAHQDVKSGHYLAGLQNGDADDLFVHSVIRMFFLARTVAVSKQTRGVLSSNCSQAYSRKKTIIVRAREKRAKPALNERQNIETGKMTVLGFFIRVIRAIRG